MEYRAGMFVYALAFLLGVVFVQQLAVLPTVSQMLGMVFSYAAIVFSSAFLLRKYLLQKHRLRPLFLCKYQFLRYQHITLTVSCILLFSIGILYASFYANQHLSHYLSEDLIGKNLMLHGTVSGVPIDDGKVQRFEFYVDRLSIIGSNNDVNDPLVNSLLTFQSSQKKYA